MVVTIRGDDLPLIGWPPGIDGWPIQNVGDDDDLDGDWPAGIDGGDGWGITNGEVPW